MTRRSFIRLEGTFVTDLPNALRLVAVDAPTLGTPVCVVAGLSAVQAHLGMSGPPFGQPAVAPRLTCQLKSV